MRSTTSFATNSLAATIVALMLTTGAAPSMSPLGRDVAQSYRLAVRAYDKARMWGVIARWWIDPEYVPVVRQGDGSAKPEDLCQVRFMGGRAR